MKNLTPHTLKRALRRRFPRATGAIAKPIRKVLPRPTIDASADFTLHEELRSIGPAAAMARYRDERRRRHRATAAYKLARTQALLGDFQAAAATLERGRFPERDRSLLRLEYLTKAGAPTATFTDLVPSRPKRLFFKGLSLLGRSVVDADSFDAYLAVAERAKPTWRIDPAYFSRLGNCARRAGRPDLAISYLEHAVRLARPVDRQASPSASPPMIDPWTVLKDFLSVTGQIDEEVFAVAGTLLGFVREGGFISHDYDMDFGIRSSSAHDELRELLRRDWRFELLLGRDPHVLKVQHINGTTIDIYLFEQDGDGWIKQSHVYGWRFDDFDTEEIDVGGMKVVVPSKADHYLEQMYGPDWRTPQPGFDSRLYAPNGFFPDRDEVICAVLNKVVAAVRSGRDSQVENFRAFLADRLSYQLPEIGSAPTDPGQPVPAVYHSGAAITVPTANERSVAPIADDFAATTPPAAVDGPAGTAADLSDGPRLAKDLAAIAERLTAPHKSRGHRPIRSASFRARMDQRVRARRYLLKYTDVLPVTEVLINKVRRDRLCAELGYPIPSKLLEDGSVEDVMALLPQHRELVIKPVVGSGGRGVLPLRRSRGGWLNLRTEAKLSAAEVEAALHATRVRDQPVRRWSAESLVVGGSNRSGHPMDYKIYMFQERAGLILAKRHLPEGATYRWLTADWQDVDTGKYTRQLDLSLPLPSDPERTISVAREIARVLPLSFVRVDLIEGTDGLFLGELTPLPGRYHQFAMPVDRELGTLWEISDATHSMSYLTDLRFAEAVSAIRRGSDTGEVFPD